MVIMGENEKKYGIIGDISNLSINFTKNFEATRNSLHIWKY